MRTTDWDNYFPHFAPEEYFSPGGLELFHGKNVIPCDIAIMHCLENIRVGLNHGRESWMESCDKEIKLIVNHGDQRLRGFVTPREWLEEREKQEGQTFSFHLWCAADVSSMEISPDILFNFAMISPCTGLIKYDWGIHIDMRQGERYISGN